MYVCGDAKLEPGALVYASGRLGLVVQVYERDSLDLDDHVVIAFPGGVPDELRGYDQVGDFVTISMGAAYNELRQIPRLVRRERAAPSLARVAEAAGGLEALLKQSEEMVPGSATEWPWELPHGDPRVDWRG